MDNNKKQYKNFCDAFLYDAKNQLIDAIDIFFDKDSRIKVDKINIGNELSYNIYNIDGGRLYTDRIHDTAVLIENKIIKEPSFQLRYNGPFIYNANIKENIVNSYLYGINCWFYPRCHC